MTKRKNDSTEFDSTGAMAAAWFGTPGADTAIGRVFDTPPEEAFAPKAKKRRVTESQVESDHRLATKAEGGIEYKFTSPGRRAVPDRLRLMPVPPEHQEIVAQYVRFREYKKPGEKPTPAQQREHDFLRGMGFTVEVIDERLK
jgi:hypothetical protein